MPIKSDCLKKALTTEKISTTEKKFKKYIKPLNYIDIHHKHA